jgi:hypothetical protein
VIRGAHLTASACLLAWVIATSVLAQPLSVEPSWRISLDAGEIRTVAFSPGATCVGIATDSTVVVVSAAGQRLWEWDYKKANRLIRAWDLAVNKSCDTVAFTGDSDYKFVWLARKNGTRTPIALKSTPSKVAFGVDTPFLAVATALPAVYGFSLQGEAQWTSKRDEENAPTGSLQDRKALSRINPFSWFDTISFSDDLRTEVRAGEPNHGPGHGWVQMARGDGASWSKTVDCHSALVSHDGSWVVIRGQVLPDDTSDDHAWDCDHVSITVVGVDGAVAHEWPAPTGRLLGVSADNNHFVLQQPNVTEGLTLDGTVAWSISTPHQDVIVSPDGRVLVSKETHGSSVALYRLPK